MVSAEISRKLDAATETTYIPEGLLQCLVPRLDKSGLGDPVHKFYMMGLAKSIHRLYACGVQRFAAVCSAAGLVPMPAEETLCHFVATLATEDLCHWTVKSYMAGIRHLHILEWHGDSFTFGLHKLHYVLHGI